MPANHSNKSCYHITITIMNILMKWSYNEPFVFIFLLRWNFYPTTNVFLNIFYFYIWTNVNTKELMQCQYDTDTSTTVNNHGLLEMKGETRWLGMSVFTCGLSEHAMNVSDTENIIGNRCTKWNWQHVIFKFFPRLRGSLSIVILKCSCRNHSSKTCSSPVKNTLSSSNIRTSVPIVKICRQR